MGDEEPLKFESHTGGDGGDEDKVPCAKCGRLIPMHSTRCPYCGIHFMGEAFEFRHASERFDATGHRFLRWIALLLIGIIVAILVLLIAVGAQ